MLHRCNLRHIQAPALSSELRFVFELRHILFSELSHESYVLELRVSHVAMWTILVLEQLLVPVCDTFFYPVVKSGSYAMLCLITLDGPSRKYLSFITRRCPSGRCGYSQTCSDRMRILGPPLRGMVTLSQRGTKIDHNAALITDTYYFPNISNATTERHDAQCSAKCTIPLRRKKLQEMENYFSST